MFFIILLFSNFVKEKVDFLASLFSNMVKGRSRGIGINHACISMFHHLRSNDPSCGELKYPGF